MNLSPLPIQKFFDNNGAPLVGGLLFTYIAGTTTKIATASNQAGTLNTNPVVLDYRGEANVWLDQTLTYKFVLAPAGDTDPPTKPIWTVDNVSAAVTYASLTQQILGQILFPRTLAEIAAGVTPTNYAIPSHDAVGYVDPLRYGTNTTPGTTDMTSALNSAISVAKQLTNGAEIRVSGYLKFTSTLLFDANRLHLVGAGKHATRLIFAPTANDVAIEFNKGASSSEQCSVRDLTIWSDDSTWTKTALDLYDVRQFSCERVAIGGSVVIGGSTYWAGNTASIGIRTRGREFFRGEDVAITADRPRVISNNPNDIRDLDHFHESDYFLIGNANPLIEVETGLNITNWTVDGYQSWNLGTHGLYWVDSSAGDISSYNVVFRGVRSEQGTSAAAHTFHIDINAAFVLQDILIEDARLDTARNGIYTRRVERVTLDQVNNPSTSNVGLDMTAIANSMLITRNCFFNTGSTATLTSYKVLFGVPNSPSQNVVANGQYGYDANASRNLTLGGAIGDTAFTLADGATAVLGTTTMLGRLIVIVTSADNSWGDFNIRGSSNVTAEIADPQGVFSITAGTATSTNIYWDGGTSRYTIENKRGGSRTYRIVFMGVYT